MKFDDIVYFKESIGWTQYRVASLHEFQDSVTLENGQTSRICKKSECLSDADYQAMRLKEEREQQEPRLKPVIEAYNSGLKTSIKIATHLKIHHLAARGKLLAAHRLKFITLPLDENGYPDPNPKDEKHGDSE